MTSDELVRRWEDQQGAYVANRQMRFDVILDAIEFHLGNAATVAGPWMRYRIAEHPHFGALPNQPV
jgi:hypothetical protein